MIEISDAEMPERRFDFLRPRDRSWRLHALERVSELTNERMPPVIAGKLGELRAAPLLVDDRWGRLGQIRSEPLPGFGGCEFRFDLRMDWRSKCEIEVDPVLTAAWHFVNAEEEIRCRVQQARREVQRILSRLDGALPTVSLTGLGVRAGADLFSPQDIMIEVMALGHGLEPVRCRADTRTVEIERGMEKILSDHARRHALLRSAQAEGARGWMQVTSERMMAEVGLEPAIVIAHLQNHATLDLLNSTRELCLYWDEGVLKCDSKHHDLRIELQDDGICSYYAWRTKDIRNRIGKRLGALARDPCIPRDTIVTGVVDRDGWEYVEVAIPVVPLLA